MYPLARHLFIFEEGETLAGGGLAEPLPNVAVIPSLMGNKKLYIGTLLADVCSQVLREFGVVVGTHPLSFAIRIHLVETGRCPREPSWE